MPRTRKDNTYFKTIFGYKTRDFIFTFSTEFTTVLNTGSANDADGRERGVHRDRDQPEGQVRGAEAARGGQGEAGATADRQ